MSAIFALLRSMRSGGGGGGGGVSISGRRGAHNWCTKYVTEATRMRLMNSILGPEPTSKYLLLLNQAL